MGQYYHTVLLSETGEVVAWFNGHSWGSGNKQVEQACRMGQNRFMKAVEAYLHAHTNLRVVWAGDYSEKMYNDNQNLHHLCTEYTEREVLTVEYPSKSLRWIVNHTKKLYIDKRSLNDQSMHPLPLLTQETDQTAGGDYMGNDECLCGDWAHDVISMASERPSEEYVAFVPKFREN